MISLPSVAVGDDTEIVSTLPDLENILGAKLANVHVVLDIVLEHLFGELQVLVDDILSRDSGFDTFFGHTLGELMGGIEQVDGGGARSLQVLEGLENESHGILSRNQTRRDLGVNENDGQGESGDDGDGRSTTDLHGLDGIMSKSEGGDGNVKGLVGEEELVNDLERATLVADCLQGCAGHGK